MFSRAALGTFVLGGALLSSVPAISQPYYGNDYGSWAPPRNQPYLEERSTSYGPYGPRTTKRFVENDPRGGKIIREEWRGPDGRRTTRRTFIDPYGNQRVVVDRY